MYDLAIIGAGWAGFNAAQTAKESGLKACLIEKAQIGGTCLNSGCIPTKTLIQSAKVFTLSKKFPTFGIQNLNPQIDFKQIRERKEKIILKLRTGMEFLLKGIDFINGQAEILSAEELRVGKDTIKAKSILVACGSSPIELGSFKFDHKTIISSDDILNLKEVPSTLLIIGGGVIGCEFAGLFAGLGSQVTVVEKMPQLLPGEDAEVAKKMETAFKKKGVQLNLNTDAEALDLKNYSLILVAVGRAPNTKGLGLENLGIKLDRGKVLVDKYLKTNIGNIYAAGDCTGQTMLAHFAAYQGRIAAGNIACPQNPQKADNQNIPNCIFTDPEIASVGLNEEKARQAGKEIKINKFDFLGSGMARILDETDGFIKIISDKDSGEVLGGAIIGPRATELISTLTLAVSCRLKIQQIRNTIFAHPTLSEAIPEALK